MNLGSSQLVTVYYFFRMVASKPVTVSILRYGFELSRAADAPERAGGGGADITELSRDGSSRCFHKPFRYGCD